MKLVAGVDEFGTETQALAGWTYLVLPEASAEALTKMAEEILATSPPESFHGKSFVQQHAPQYTDFLTAVRQTLESAPLGLAANTLLNPTWKKKFTGFSHRVVAGVCAGTGVDTEEMLLVLKSLAPSLLTLLRLTSDLRGAHRMALEIHSDQQKKKLHDANVAFGPVRIAAPMVLASFCNSYKKKQFPNAPEMTEDGMRVLRDTRSAMIQAADVLGNFSMAYVFVKLGKKSKSKERKAQIFEAVFGDTMEPINFREVLELHGNDLVLKLNGAFTFRIGF